MQQLNATLTSPTTSPWLPLYGRLIARLSRISDFSQNPSSTGIQITSKGIELFLAFPRGGVHSTRLMARKKGHFTHKTRITCASEIDDEIVLWVKAALHQARSAKHRSI